MAESQSPERSELEAAIEDQVEEWSTSSNDALHISILRGSNEVADFGPAFTYPIFGEEEVVFGYRGLSMNLTFAAHNLRPHMDISWQEQFPQLGNIKASDIRGTLEDFVPQEAFAEKTPSDALSDPNAADFTPPGTLVHSYTQEGNKFEIWQASLTEPGAKELLENAQILVLLFIEGGTMLQLDEPWVTRRWKVFFLYRVHEKQPALSSYSIVGYATSYRVFTLPDRREPTEADLALLNHEGTEIDAIVKRWDASSTEDPAQTLESPLQLPSRERISQFLILPPYQGSGHGPCLYNTMFKALIAPENVCELTVEDPNEAFDDMRDVCDLVFLREHNDDFASLSVNPNVESAKLHPSSDIPVDDIVDGEARARIKKSSKIMPRQFGRLVEMQTLSKIPHSHRSVSRLTRREKSSNEMDRAYFFWRLYVKQRLYVSNRDVLAQLDREERAEKLEATVESVQADYDRLVALADKRASLANDETKNGDRKRKKRKVVVADEDDGEEDDEVIKVSTKKKRKTG